MIRDFKTAAYLARMSGENAKRRGALDVPEPQEAARVLVESGYPVQPTSWNAVYHVLQRYGAWRAVMELGHVFNAQGFFLD